MTFCVINSCKTLVLVLLHMKSIKSVFCRYWVVFVCGGDKWAQSVPLLTAAPELWCYLQLFSLLLQLLLPLWPQGLQHQFALWNQRHTTLHTLIHLYNSILTDMSVIIFTNTVECIRYAQKNAPKVTQNGYSMHNLHYTVQHAKYSKHDSKCKMQLFFTGMDRNIIHKNNRININNFFINWI